ncbi:MAG: membrane dipeptidase [Bacteroidales bacterium]|nr:membrane dipeptidase [Bacteroidales bacterium]
MLRIIEGGFAIRKSLSVLNSFYRLGARYMTLTWGETNDLADSATDKPIHGGLSELEKKSLLR